MTQQIPERPEPNTTIIREGGHGGTKPTLTGKIFLTIALFSVPLILYGIIYYTELTSAVFVATVFALMLFLIWKD